MCPISSSTGKLPVCTWTEPGPGGNEFFLLGRWGFFFFNLHSELAITDLHITGKLVITDLWMIYQDFTTENYGIGAITEIFTIMAFSVVCQLFRYSEFRVCSQSSVLKSEKVKYFKTSLELSPFFFQRCKKLWWNLFLRTSRRMWNQSRPS